jgi:hypothetical protein
MSTPIPTSGNLGNFLSNFNSEIQIMIIGTILVFFIIGASVLLRKRRRKFK